MKSGMEENDKRRVQTMVDANPFLPIHQIIYTLLREDIISCRFPPGTRITEEQCAGLYGSSRTTVRKVFDRLAEEKLLERDDPRKIFVSRISKEDHLKLMEYRMSIEPPATRLAARNRTRDDLKQIEKYADLCNTDDIHELCINDLKFHRAVFAASRNAYLIAAYEQIDSRISRGKLYQMPDYKNVCEVCYREHYAIYEKIRAGEEGAAQKLAFQHIKMMLDAHLD